MEALEGEQEQQQQQVIRVARRVYVGNLAWTTTWQDLKDHFSQIGPVKYADVLREAGPGSRSKGCGVVEYSTPEEAAASIQKLNHSELSGRTIFVREDREDFELKGEPSHEPSHDRPGQKRPRAASATPGAGSGALRTVAIGRRLYVGNLSYETTWQHVKDHFRAAGAVYHVEVLMDSEGRSKGCALVEMEQAADALRAISLLSNSVLNGRNITVREDREDPDAKPGRPASRATLSSGAFASASTPSEGMQIVIHGLPYRMAWQDLKDLCRPAGTVLRADVILNMDGSSKGYGVVTFVSQRDAAAAIAMLNGKVIDGRVITCKYDKFAGPPATPM